MWEIIGYTVLWIFVYWLATFIFFMAWNAVDELINGPDYKFGSMFKWRSFKFFVNLYAVMAPLLPLIYVVIGIRWILHKIGCE